MRRLIPGSEGGRKRADLTAPDFAIVGVRWGDRFLAVGSSDLSHAELRATMSLDAYRNDEPEQYALHAAMRGFQTGVGDNYAAALRDLLSKWEPGQRGLPPSPPRSFPG